MRCYSSALKRSLFERRNARKWICARALIRACACVRARAHAAGSRNVHHNASGCAAPARPHARRLFLASLPNKNNATASRIRDSAPDKVAPAAFPSRTVGDFRQIPLSHRVFRDLGENPRRFLLTIRREASAVSTSSLLYSQNIRRSTLSKDSDTGRTTIIRSIVYRYRTFLELPLADSIIFIETYDVVDEIYY